MQKQFGVETEVELIAGSGGVFEVRADGHLVYSKKETGRFPEEGEVTGRIRREG